jgi:photosystem II stability/assembly factor-like uncharacterized protein
VSGDRVGPLSFVSPTHGYGLIEFDTSGQSTAQQLVVTDDGGVTWQAVAAVALPAWASTLAFTDADDGYAWGSQGLDVTHDGGRRWDLSLSLAPGDASVSPTGASIWAISSADELETSSDGGSTWHPVTQPPLSRAAVIDRVSMAVAYVLGLGQAMVNGSPTAALARTEDGGMTWQTFTVPQGCAWNPDWCDLVALTTDDLWLVQFSSPATDMSSKWVYRSYGGGAHWTLMASVNLGNPNQGTGQLFSTGDFGPLSVLASEPDRAWLAEDRGGLLVTTDGGRHWQPAFSDPNADANGPPTVSFLDAEHGWAATGDGLWRTTDGTTWTEIGPPPPGSGQ